MAKKPQRFFGVYQDMTSLKIATLTLENRNQLRVVGLDRVELPEVEDAVDDEFLKEFDFAGGAPDAGAFDDLLDDADLPTDGVPQEQDGEVQEDIAPTRNDLVKAITEELAMYDGAIALNLDIFNVNYRTVPVLPGAKKKAILQDVRATMAAENVSAAVYRCFPLDDDSVVGVSCQGSMDLLENMLDVAQMFPRRSLCITSIQTDEMALINALRMHYNLEAHEVSAVFYIGREYSRVLALQGGNFLAALPIFNEGVSADNIMMKVHSRFLLDKQQHRIPELDRIFVAGDDIDESMLGYLRDSESQAQVELLLPLIFPVETGADVSPEEVASFIIPIMLGAAAAFPKDAALITTNFTPRKLLERQNILSLGIPSVLILATLVGVLYLSLDNAFSLGRQNRSVAFESTELERRIEKNMAIIDSIGVIEAEIAAYEQKNYYVRHFIGDNNQWRNILEELSSCFQDRPLTWATNVHRVDGGFKLEGATTDRHYVLAVASLFPNTRIEELSETEIESYTVWKYKLACGLPDALAARKRETGPQRNKFGVVDEMEPESPSPDTAPQQAVIAGERRHLVRSGETLSSLAVEYRTTVEDLKRLNDLREETIFIGQMLTVPGKDEAPADERTYSPQTAPQLDPDSYMTYVVRQGDNLFRVSLKFDTTVEEIRRVNGLETEVIYAGQELKILRKRGE